MRIYVLASRSFGYFIICLQRTASVAIKNGQVFVFCCAFARFVGVRKISMLNATGCSRDGLVWVQILYGRRWSSQCAPHSRALAGSTVREYLVSSRIWNVVESEGWRRTRSVTDIARTSMSAHIRTRTRKHTLTLNIDCRTDAPYPTHCCIPRPDDSEEETSPASPASPDPPRSVLHQVTYAPRRCLVITASLRPLRQ